MILFAFINYITNTSKRDEKDQIIKLCRPLDYEFFFVFIKSGAQKFRPRLNIREHQLLEPQGLILQTYPKPRD